MKTTKHLVSGMLVLILIGLAACSSGTALPGVVRSAPENDARFEFEEILTPAGSPEEKVEKAEDEIAVEMPDPLPDADEAKKVSKGSEPSGPKEKEKAKEEWIAADRFTEEAASLPPTTPEMKAVPFISVTHEEPRKEGPMYEAVPFTSESLP